MFSPATAEAPRNRATPSRPESDVLGRLGGTWTRRYVALAVAYDLIQEHIDAQQYPPSDRQVAHQMGVTQTTLSNWRSRTEQDEAAEAP